MTLNQDFSGFVFLDIETTGLEPHDDEILEIGIVLTDESYNELDAKSWIIATEEAQSAMRHLLSSDPEGYVTKMHKENGLADELLSVAAERTKRSYMLEIIDWLGERDALLRPMCGSSIGSLDRPFLKHHMRELNDAFHYRSGDASAIRVFIENSPLHGGVWKELEEKVRAEAKSDGEVMHRTLSDARYSAALTAEFFRRCNIK